MILHSTSSANGILPFQGLCIIRVFGGPGYNFVVCSNGAVYSWGSNDAYRLGHGVDDMEK